MGVTYIQARLRRPDGRGPARTVRFLVDSGAIYSVLPAKVWRALRLRAERKVEFTLADGTPIERGASECRFEIQGKAATSPVVLGVERDGALLGAVTLETLGLMLHPLTREILPMRWPYPMSAGSGSQKNSRREIPIRRRGIDEHYAASHTRIVDHKITWNFCLHVTPEDKTVLKIDIDKLSEEELIDLNHRIVERLRFLNQKRPIRRCWTSRSATASPFSRKAVSLWLECSPAIIRRPLRSSPKMASIGTSRPASCAR